ncbi:MAG: acyl-CoA thioesterase [Pseudobdellovibrionaceae bacterium]|nr:acyl-CoA thioesterase [Bdellovibrionales bacterium]USN46548.1 MAG: acyl-CoA thioesterase [Pseudobdellovibrionaceae bacterium]
MIFKKDFTVRFDQADPAGILFFGQAFFIAHQTIEEFVNHLGIEWKDWFQNGQWGVPIRHAEADFKRPLFPGHKYLAQLQIENLGNSSIRFQVKFFDGDSVCAHLILSHVFTDVNTLKSRPIPEDLRKLLLPYEVNELPGTNLA